MGDRPKRIKIHAVSQILSYVWTWLIKAIAAGVRLTQCSGEFHWWSPTSGLSVWSSNYSWQCLCMWEDFLEENWNLRNKHLHPSLTQFLLSHTVMFFLKHISEECKILQPTLSPSFMSLSFRCFKSSPGSWRAGQQSVFSGESRQSGVCADGSWASCTAAQAPD